MTVQPEIIDIWEGGMAVRSFSGPSASWTNTTLAIAGGSGDPVAGIAGPDYQVGLLRGGGVLWRAVC